jgi:hypothetical protein
MIRLSYVKLVQTALLVAVLLIPQQLLMGDVAYFIHERRKHICSSMHSMPDVISSFIYWQSHPFYWQSNVMPRHRFVIFLFHYASKL